jgi:hypothetical protein
LPCEALGNFRPGFSLQVLAPTHNAHTSLWAFRFNPWPKNNLAVNYICGMNKYSNVVWDAESKLRELISLHKDFLVDRLSEAKAYRLSEIAWSLTDWVQKDYSSIHGISDLGAFRATLYPRCNDLKIIHDLCQFTKHSEVSKPKAKIKLMRVSNGALSSSFSRDFDVSVLQIELENGSISDFLDCINSVVEFWKDYFRNTIKVEVPE